MVTTQHEIRVESAARILSMLEKSLPDHPAISQLTYDLLKLHSLGCETDGYKREQPRYNVLQEETV